MDEQDDPCRFKHGGNENSIAAIRDTGEGYHQALRDWFADMLVTAGFLGVTRDEFLQNIKKYVNPKVESCSTSPRVTEMVQWGETFEIGVKRKTQRNRNAQVCVSPAVYAQLCFRGDPCTNYVSRTKRKPKPEHRKSKK
jgi:hypothetical protein